LLDEAIQAMEQSIRLSPRDPFIGSRSASLGEVHLLQSRIDEAIRWLGRARSANPGRPRVHLWLASAYGLKGETERAAGELAEARSLAGVGSYPSIAGMRPGADYVAKVHALYDTTYLAGLRRAGMPEE
jgi:predicted Zn-dependent protease